MTDDLRQIPDFPQCLADAKGNIYRQYNNGKLHKLSQRSDKYGYMTIRIVQSVVSEIVLHKIWK